MEQAESKRLSRLPSRKIVLATLIALATVLTLTLVHVSGQWVGQRVFKQIYQPSKQHLRSREGFRKIGRLSWQYLQDGKRKNYDWRLDAQPPPSPSVDDFYQEVNMSGNKHVHVDPSSSLGSVPSENIFQDMRPDSADPGNQAIGVRDHIDRVLLMDGARDSDRDTVLVNHTSGKSVSTTEKLLEGAVRREMVQIHPVHVQPATGKPQKGRSWSMKNVYPFNDRDRKSYRKLPMRGKADIEWKREEALIFNRVGKCGSRTVIELLRKLSDMNNFNLVSSTVYNTTSLTSEWQGYIVSVLDQLRTPYLFQRHLYFVDFNDFKAKQPMYINIIRDPLARFVSSYYFKRFGDGKSNQNFKGTEEYKYRSVTECIVQGYNECVRGGQFYIIPFFCGQHKACRKPSQWALDRAKENVKKHFVVVGILEDLENSFRVFEKVLPRYFKGVVKLLLEPDEKQVLKNASTVTKFKEKPSPEAEVIMKGLMHYEYEFYDFVKDRLEKQKAQYGIGNKR